MKITSYTAGGLIKVVHGMVRAYGNIQQWRPTREYLWVGKIEAV
jgi:hypothetical protein